MRPAKATAAGICMLIPVIGIVFAAQAMPAGKAGALLAIYPPWWSSERALQAASDAGDISAGSARGFAFVVRSSRPDLPERLRASGAIMILNPRGDGGCFSEPGDSSDE